MRDNKICPALILASRRKHKVIGRTTILTISTSLKKAIRYQGELAGTRRETFLVLITSIRILINHNIKAALRLKARVVVTGYLYATKEIKFNRPISKNILK
jgi:hypothetical protein